MRVLFISANRAEINMRTIPFGMAEVAQAAKTAGHEVKLLDLMSAPEPLALLAAAIEEFPPQVIGISLRNIDAQNMHQPHLFLEQDREIIRRCKSLSSAAVVLGGAGYSIFPESALSYSGADMGIQGEGEAAFLRLIERMERGESPADVPGLFLAGKGLRRGREFVNDLDQLALPDAEWFSTSQTVSDDFWFPVQTRRGCPLDCSYCSTATIEGRTIRKRSPDKVVQWMSALAQRGFRRFYFVDNTFNLPPSYAQSLCDTLIRASLDLAWRCILYPHKLDEPLVEAMAQAGCREASVGFESGCPRILGWMNKRFGKQDVRETFRLLRKYGIRGLGFLLLGGPGETRESVEESLAFADSLEPDFLKITVGLRIYPYTRLAEQARAEKIISPADDLLHPKFYMTPDLEYWIRETVAKWAETRRHWMM